MDGILPFVYIGLCLALGVSVFLIAYWYWLLGKAELDIRFIETATKAVRLNMLIASISLVFGAIAKETVIGEGFLVPVVVLQFVFSTFVWIYQTRFKIG